MIPSSSDSLLEAAVGAGLFENLPERCVARRGNAAGEARMREPVRDQVELRAVDLDSLIGIRRGCSGITRRSSIWVHRRHQAAVGVGAF